MEGRLECIQVEACKFAYIRLANRYAKWLDELPRHPKMPAHTGLTANSAGHATCYINGFRVWQSSVSAWLGC
jgi:hypothetical protein